MRSGLKKKISGDCDWTSTLISGSSAQTQVYTPTQLECPQFQGCCSVTDPDLWPRLEGPDGGFEYHVDIKGQGESFEQLVIFHQPDWFWRASAPPQAGVQRRVWYRDHRDLHSFPTFIFCFFWQCFFFFVSFFFLGVLWWSTTGGHGLPFSPSPCL